MSTQSIILNTLTAIEERRSIKYFDANYKIPEADTQKLIESALLSPTSFNIQNWRFVVVNDSDLKIKIRDAAWNQAQITDCSVLFILCADLKAAEKRPERYWQNAPQNIQDMLVPMIGQYYNDNPQLQRDEAMRSCGIASQTLMLAAKAMGYDSCPMVGFDPVKVAEIIHLPSDHLITMMLPIGKALKPANPRGGQLPQEEVVIWNQFK